MSKISIHDIKYHVSIPQPEIDMYHITHMLNDEGMLCISLSAEIRLHLRHWL